MRVTIVKDDNKVIVDGEAHTVNCAPLPAGFHALQWDGTRGEVEYAVTHCEHCGAHSKKANVQVSDLSPYEPYLDLWRTAKALAEDAAAETKSRDAAG